MKENHRTKYVAELQEMMTRKLSQSSGTELRVLCETMPASLRDAFIQALKDTNEDFPEKLRI